MQNVVCIGGGAASFFFAANAAPACPDTRFIILEQGAQVLGKVKVSGGGRCNVTHHCFDPGELIQNYPRGSRELHGPFHKFGPVQTIEWFESRGVRLKTEEDGRMFPVTDNSQTVIDCLMGQCRDAGVEVRTRAKVRNIKREESRYMVELLDGASMAADVLFVAPGSSNQMWQVLGHLGHTIVSPVPSLFTFQIDDSRLRGLPGVSVSNVSVALPGMKLKTSGPMLITHRGLSGPAILKMSAFGARDFHEMNYTLDITVDWIPDMAEADIRRWRDEQGKKLVGNHQLSGLPRRLFQSLIDHAGLDQQKKLASISNKEIEQIIGALKRSVFHVKGQNRFKEEFVTAGGVDLAEINFQNFESKRLPGVYMAGEVLNIDAVTGGFNFQAAWTGAFIAGQDMIQRHYPTR